MNLLKINKPTHTSIRMKLLLIYLLCVLIPIIIFSSAFYSSAMKGIENEKLILYGQALDRISSAIASNAVSAIQLSNIIYPDDQVYEYLNRSYPDKKICLDYYNEYLSYAWIKILPYNTKIALFTVYTNNNTVLNSINIQYLDNSVQNSGWYQEYLRIGSGSRFIRHKDQLMLAVSSMDVKLVSYIRDLDYFNNGRYKHVLRITFQSDMFDSILRTEKLPGNLYVVDSDNMIIAQSDKTAPEYSMTEFISFDNVKADPRQMVLSSPISAMSGWRVICILDKDFMEDDFRIYGLQIILLIIVLTIFASVVIWLISNSLYKRIAMLAEHFGKVEKGEYTLISEDKKGSDEIGMLFSATNKMITKIRSLIEDVYKAELKHAQIELLKKQSELNALQCQVNPHFMFNVLETIRIKSYMKNEFETARIIMYMSKIFRKLLLWNDDMISLGEEISFIREYLAIQQYRYEDELETTIDMDADMEDLLIPKMTLQTFVDNACEHGFSDSKGLKIVRISVKREDGKIVMKVYDNGTGMSAALIDDVLNRSNIGIGIKNVVGRLDVYYKDRYELDIRSKEGEYTEVVLTIQV